MVKNNTLLDLFFLPGPRLLTVITYGDLSKCMLILDIEENLLVQSGWRLLNSTINI